MTSAFKKAWAELVLPILQRPKRLQVAALCYRQNDAGKKVLLVTSRGTGRWIIPKGWPMLNKNAGEAALQEAWEEAGVHKGEITGEMIGHYDYDKELKSGLPVAVQTLVFPVKVSEMRDKFPESSQRKRKWVSPAEAAKMVQEPQLQKLLLDF